MISPRSKQTEAKYHDFKAAKLAAGADLTVFNLDEEKVVREFDHWLIIENRFPYDMMTSVNHLLVPKRQLTDFSEASDAEQAEHRTIQKILAGEAFYDAIVENFPRSKSVTRHAHLHLVRWKYTDEHGKNKSESIHHA